MVDASGRQLSVTVAFKDEDDDAVVVKSPEELQHAVSLARALKWPRVILVVDFVTPDQAGGQSALQVADKTGIYVGVAGCVVGVVGIALYAAGKLRQA